MNSISICIPTYKRPDGLKKLLLSIKDCDIDKTLINTLYIIIVDNDKERSAFELVSDLAENELNAFDLSYFHYPMQGLAKVRNELLKRAFERNTDYIAFIDDDEFADPVWLNQLVTTIVHNDADLVMGPVQPVFEKEIPDSIAKWLYRKDHNNNQRLHFIRSGNLIINASRLRSFNIWFNPHFDKMGGEDSYFGKKMAQKGALIHWAANAVAYETTPETRTKLVWLLKRKYRGAFMFTYILKMEKEYLKLFKKVCFSFIYLIIGILSAPLILIPFRNRYWGIMKINEALGSYASLFNMTYVAYK